MLPINPWAYSILLVLGFQLLYRWARKWSSHPLPPGPPHYPLIGSMLSFPREYLWIGFAKHRDRYGPISSLSFFGQHFIILNEKNTAEDLLNGRSSIYSDRPSLPFAVMCDMTHVPNLRRYDSVHRAQRKSLQQYFGSNNAIVRTRLMVEMETRRMLARILATPADVHAHARSFGASIVLKSTYGYSVDSDLNQQDPLVHEAEDAVRLFVLAIQPAAWLVDQIPMLKHIPDWFPGAGFKQTAKAWRKRTHNFAERPYRFARKQMAFGNAYPSYVSSLYENLQDELDPEEEFNFKWAAAGMYGAGSDTTAGAISSFFLAMVLYPEVQRKAQEEIDRVIGPDRLPTYYDQENLPFINATLKEVLRWHTVVPMGLTHATMEDDIYEGYLIPKGSLILPNIWLFNHDPKNYHDPLMFKPERFLGASPEMDPSEVTFGFGRRVCAGRRLAEMTIFTAVAVTLATLNIFPAKDDKGEYVIPTYEATDGVLSHPKAYSCSVAARSTKAMELILSIETDEEAQRNDSDALRAIVLD